MTINNDLLNTFGRLFQNRQFNMAIHRQSQFLEQRNQATGRGQVRLLHLLHDHPVGLSNTDISNMLDIKPSSVTAMVKHLEHHQLAERIPNQQDKRSTLVRISTLGQQQFTNLEKISAEIAEKLFTGLSDTEKQTLNQLLLKLNDYEHDVDWSDLQQLHHQQHGWRGDIARSNWQTKTDDKA